MNSNFTASSCYPCIMETFWNYCKMFILLGGMLFNLYGVSNYIYSHLVISIFSLRTVNYNKQVIWVLLWIEFKLFFFKIGLNKDGM